MIDENREELEKIEKMSVYERLAYLRKLALFYRQLGADNSMIEDVLLITRGYNNA